MVVEEKTIDQLEKLKQVNAILKFKENQVNQKKIIRKKKKKRKPRIRKHDPNSQSIVLSFYETKEWQELRFIVLKLFPRFCMKCKKHRITLQIDHCFPRALFPNKRLDLLNMQVLCPQCNKEKKNFIVDYRTPLEKEKLKVYLERFPSIKNLEINLRKRIKKKRIIFEEDLNYIKYLKKKYCSNLYWEDLLENERLYIENKAKEDLATDVARPKYILRKKTPDSQGQKS